MECAALLSTITRGISGPSDRNEISEFQFMMSSVRAPSVDQAGLVLTRLLTSSSQLIAGIGKQTLRRAASPCDAYPSREL